jgi:anthranilate phosphoribosyltransferase
MMSVAHGTTVRSGKRLAGTTELLSAALVVVELGVEEVVESSDAVGFGFLDVLHPPEDVLA